MYLAMGAVGVLVVPETVHAFHLPRLVVVAITSAFLLGWSARGVTSLFQLLPRAGQAVVALVGIWVAWLVGGLMLGEAPALSLLGYQSRFVGGVALLAPAVLVVAIPLLLRTARQIDTALWVLCALIGLASLYAVVQFAGLDPMPWTVERGGRAVSFYGNSNFVGAVLCLGVPLAWWLWSTSLRTPAVALFLVTGVALYGSQARLGLVAAVGGLLVAILIGRPLPWRRLQGWVTASSPGGAVLGGLGIVAVGAAVNDATSVVRVSLWTTAGRMWLDQPVMGQGVGRFVPAYRQFRTPEEVTAQGLEGADLAVDTSHAFVLDLLSTGGLLAAVLWLALLGAIGMVLRRIWLAAPTAGTSDRARVAILAGLLAAHGLQSSISVPIISTVWIGWLLVGLVLALSTAIPHSTTRRGSGHQRPKRELASPVLALALTALVAIPATGLWRSHNALGHVQTAEDLGHPEAALTLAQDARQRTPWWPEPWHAEIRVRQAVGDLRAAQALADQALEIDPRDRITLGLQANLAVQLEGPDAAAIWFRRLREVDPNGVELHLDLLAWAQATDRPDVAEEARTVIEAGIDPSHEMWDRYEDILHSG